MTDEDAGPERFCVSCGESLTRSMEYCPSCGTNQAAASTDPPADAGGRTDDGAGGRSATSESTGDAAPGAAPRKSGTEGRSTPAPDSGDVGSTPVVERAIDALPGMNRQHTTRRNFLVGGGYALVGLAAVGALSDSADEGAGGPTGATDGGDGGSAYPNAWYADVSTGIVILSAEGSVSQYSVDITGEVLNDSGQDYSYLQLGFALYDSADAKVGDALANTSGLEAGQRWRFQAFGTNADAVDSFGIEDVTAY